MTSLPKPDAGSPPGSGLVVRWTDRPEDLAPLHDDWQALAEQTGADPYMMPDWQRIWWRHFGKGRRFACMTAHAQGRLVGVLPFCLQTHWAGPLPLRLARLAGTDPHCMVFRLPVAKDFLAPVLEAALGHLCGPGACDAVSFTPLSQMAEHLAVLRALAGPGSGLSLHEAGAGTHVVFDLPPDFDAFQEHLSKKRRAQFRRDVKGLEDGFGMRARHDIADAGSFSAFVEFHNRQWQAIGRGGHFVDWPGSAAFYQDLARDAAARGVMQLHSLTGTDAPLATQFALVAGKTAHWRLPARSLDPAAERLSAGKVGLLSMIEKLIADGVTLIEAGRGDYGYKLDYGGRSAAVHRLILRSGKPGAGLRLRLLLASSDLLDFCYYRVWFLKLAPRLQGLSGRKPRPLWRSWIRTRV